MRIRRIRKFIRPAFHWKFSSFFIAIFYGGGATVVGASDVSQRFVVGYVLFALGGAWAMGYWLTSDWLMKQAEKLRQREIKRNEERLKQETKKLYATGYSVSLLIVGITGVCMLWTHSTKLSVLAAARQKQQENLYNNVAVQPIGLPILEGTKTQGVEFSITDNSESDMSDHTVDCLITSMWDSHVNGFPESYIFTPQAIEKGLLRGGHGETVDCNSRMKMNGPIVCMDVWMKIHFAIAGRSEAMIKPYRFSYDIERPNRWTQESLGSRRDFCDKYFNRAIHDEKPFASIPATAQ